MPPGIRVLADKSAPWMMRTYNVGSIGVYLGIGIQHREYRGILSKIRFAGEKVLFLPKLLFQTRTTKHGTFLILHMAAPNSRASIQILSPDGQT